ncbi:ABC transporter ATP-binding protein [Tissierella creatinini]|nr:ABC transporter ATP-binding protein [Tissierella creatinini]TJX63842.1 ABC transporter ATP-binding protein [Soehngenia saccharolytica]
MRFHGKGGISMITVKRLQKKFKDFYALKNVDMHVKKGEIYGFIGPNGSGKTTTMNILAGLSRPAQGECTVNGLDVTKLTHPGDLKIGYLPEDPKFYPWMTAHETLDYLSGGRNTGHTGEILKWTGLLDARNRRVGGFSRGMKQRLGIGAALIRNPELLILDEPSSALDPEGRSEVLRLIKDLKGIGKTILFSTHILDDVERICDTVGMIDAGQMMFEKPLRQLQKENMQPIFDIIPAHSVESNILNALERLTGVVSLTKSERSLTVKVADNTVSVSVMRFLADHEIVIESFSQRKTRLEDLFLQGVNTK